MLYSRMGASEFYFTKSWSGMIAKREKESPRTREIRHKKEKTHTEDSF